MRSTPQFPQPGSQSSLSPAGEHTVQFYDTDDSLLEMLSRFVHEGLKSGEACVIIATRARQARLGEQLRASGIDPADARRRGLLITMDAEKTLASFMEGDCLNRERFKLVAGRAIQRGGTGERKVRVFGEMAALLWLAGNEAAALELEALWNELQAAATPTFHLYCAYPLALFARDTRGNSAAVIEPHSHVILDDGLREQVGPDGWLRAIERLQRQTHALNVEIAERQLVEKRLRLSEERYRSLFEGSRDGMLRLDGQTGRIEEVNPAAAHFLDRPRGELIGCELGQIGLFGDRRAADAALRAMAEQTATHYEVLAFQSADGQQRFLELTSNQIEADGHGVIQCTLRDVTERQTRARLASERMQELEALHAVTSVALAQLPLDMLVRQLLERTLDVLKVDNAAILLPDTSERELRMYMARGPEEAVAGQVRVPIGQGVAGTIASSRKPLVIDDLRAVRVANPFLQQRLRSLMGVPLVVEDRLVGVIHVATIRPRQFTDSEVRLLELVAERVALAIARARLHQEAQGARQEAIERARELQATFEAITDGLIVVNHAGRLLQMNAAAQEILGRDTLPERGVALADLPRHRTRDPQGRTLPVEEWPISRILRGEVITGAHAVDLVIDGAGGQDCELSVSGAPILDESAHVLGGVCVFQDVTEKRRLERRTHAVLNALLAMASALVELPAEANTGAGGATGDTGDTGVAARAEVTEATPGAGEPGTSAVDESLGASPVAYRLAQLVRDVLDCKRVGIVAIEPESGAQWPAAVVGLSPEVERTWWAEQLARPRSYGEGMDPHLLERFAAGQSAVIDMTQPPYNMRPNPYGITTTLVAPMRVGAQLVGALALDFAGAPHTFTEQERALTEAIGQLVALVLERERILHEREEARASALAAQEITRRIHTFMGIAGHELRTPITAIKTGVQVSEKALRGILDSPLEPEAARLVRRAQTLLARADSQSNRLTRLIEDIMDVTRTQADRLDLHREARDLRAVAWSAVEGQRLAWPDRTITLDEPGVPVNLTLDPDRIEQVITNLLSNALKYSAEDQPVAVQVGVANGVARLAVHDHGPGLSPEMRAGIWEPFHQVEGVRQLSGSGVGLGLGLYICRSLIERHGGRCGVESEVGEGSTFWFELPMELESTAGSAEPA